MPPLRGPGLALRPWAPGLGDGIMLSKAWTDPDVVRWTTVPQDRSVEAARRWIGGEGERRASGRAVELVITKPDDTDHVDGEVGFVLAEPTKGWAEVGYWLFPEARGGGRATIALRLLSDWALHHVGLTRLFARTNAGNPRAAAVAQRAGYDLAGELDGGVQVWVLDGRPTDG